MDEPLSFWQGDTVSWSKAFDTYPSTAAWILTYLFSKIDDSRSVVASSQPDGSFLVTLTPEQSGLFIPGQYRWQSYVERSGERYTQGSSSLQVFPTLSTTQETRTNAETILDAIDAVMQGKATRDQKTVSIGGQALERLTWEEMTKARSYFNSIVNRERQERSTREGTSSPGFVVGSF